MPPTQRGSKSKKNIKLPNLLGSKSGLNIKSPNLPGTNSKKNKKSSNADASTSSAQNNDNFNYTAAGGVVICSIIALKTLPFLSLIAFFLAVYLGTLKLQPTLDTGVTHPTAATFLQNKRALSPGRLRYYHAGGWCPQKMTATFLDDHNRHKVIISDGNNTIELPPGAKQIRVSFGMKGGAASLKKVDRRHPKQPWVKSEDKGEYIVDVFDFDRGDGVDALFELQGRALGMYVKKAWDDGRAKFAKPRHWEWWDDRK